MRSVRISRRMVHAKILPPSLAVSTSACWLQPERETEEEMMEIVVMVRPMSIDVYPVCRAANALP